MHGSIKVVSFSQEDTGIEGHIQIYTQFTNNYFVKYFENLTDYDRYLRISLDDFTITENNLKVSEHRKKMILMYIMKNVKHIHNYYYYGFTMECCDTLELYGKFQELTPNDVKSCLNYKL